VRIESFVDTELTLALYSDPIIPLMKTERGGLYSLSTRIFGRAERAEYDRQLDQKWKNNAQSCVVSF
jgi:hypothetical protein